MRETQYAEAGSVLDVARRAEPAFDVGDTNVSQNTAYWNVFYNGTPEIPLSNDAINSPEFATYIDASIALGESLRVLAELQEIYDSIYGNGAPVPSTCKSG